jgi:ubiquinone biosynthesis accessory factor UbiJ
VSGSFAHGRIEAAINAALELDPETARRMAGIEGRTIRVLTGAPWPEVWLTARDGRVMVLEAGAGTPDVEVRGSPAAFARLAFGEFDPRLFADGTIVIEGDAELARELRAIARELDPDWEEWLARRIGDVPAHELGNALRGLRGFLRSAGATLARDAGEYLGEERGLLAPRGRVERLLGEIDDLASDVERLAERVRRLEEARDAVGEGAERSDP